ncbi:MAG: hypothetical protein SVX43_01080 [Cyanobacteriota bacterium]|nr:hypothetical protein [Cyanobacteriota bacterium]
MQRGIRMFFIALYKHFFHPSQARLEGRPTQHGIEPQACEHRHHAKDATEAICRVREFYFVERRSIL